MGNFSSQVSQKVQESLVERAQSFGLVLDDISLVSAINFCLIVQFMFMLNITILLSVEDLSLGLI